MFLGKLRRILTQKSLNEQVSDIGEAMALPVITVRCTPAVVREIEALDEVATVLADDAEMHPVR